tara:strand:- start:18 stop:575 length:558 start_codon:yes stop_codon:yes gene_type:complete
MPRPVYTPPEKIETSLYTSGNEWMFISDDTEYIGLYHQYPNGSVFSEAQFNDLSQELVQYAPAIETEFGNVYYNLTQARFNNYVEPIYYHPIPDNSDYNNANIARYFVQKRNNLSQIMEIDAKSFKSINRKNQSGIDAGRYQKTTIQWSITGPIDSVRIANERVMRNSVFDNISDYLTDPLEFYK